MQGAGTRKYEDRGKFGLPSQAHNGKPKTTEKMETLSVATQFLIDAGCEDLSVATSDFREESLGSPKGSGGYLRRVWGLLDKATELIVDTPVLWSGWGNRREDTAGW